MNTLKPNSDQEKVKSKSLVGTLVGVAGLAAASYAVKHPDKVMQVAKKVFKVGRTALNKMDKLKDLKDGDRPRSKK
jgi:gamma-glutamylcyclotransferase (GGCT)/AIG2-like uncharacterized protein YtfP